MNYTLAMTRLVKGEPVARAKWQRFNAPHLKLCGARGQVCRVFGAVAYLNPVPFVAELEDLRADDWFVVAELSATAGTS